MQYKDIHQFTIFDHVDTEKLDQLNSVHHRVKYEIGQHLISRFQTNEYIFLLLEGQAKVYLHENEEPINVIDAGDSIGEISVLDGLPGSVFVIATEVCEVVKISKVDILELMDQSHAFTKNLLQILVQRLRLVNDKVDSSIQLHQQMAIKASRDGLTGLYNRSWFDEHFDSLLQRCIDAKHDFAYIMIDIDHFKQVNDQYGHAAGDVVLQQIAELLMHYARLQDFAVRYGGEEMCYILPNTNLQQALQLAERLRQAVADHDFIVDDNLKINITISLGCSSYTGLEDKTVLMKQADDALYFAKKHGRNQVRSFVELPS